MELATLGRSGPPPPQSSVDRNQVIVPRRGQAVPMGPEVRPAITANARHLAVPGGQEKTVVVPGGSEYVRHGVSGEANPGRHLDEDGQAAMGRADRRRLAASA